MRQDVIAWTDRDFAEIEEKLHIALPETYRAFINDRAVDLSKLSHPSAHIGETDSLSEEFWFDITFFFFQPGFVASRNLDFRSPNSMVGHAFPDWWKEYFVFATNGGSGMYALRLDGDPAVWLLECDGGRMEEAYESINQLVDDSLKRYKHNLPLYEAERDWFHQVQKGEMTREEFKRKSEQLEFWF